MSDRSKVIAKIKALMAKTVENGCTEAEAMSALDLAQAMMNANDVTEADLIEVKDEKAIINFADIKDTHKIGWMLGYWISKFTETYSYGDNKQVKYVGLKSDVEFAMFLHSTLIGFVRSQLTNYLWETGAKSLQGNERHRVVNSFVIGCCSRINTRLMKLTNERIKSINKNAMIVAKDALIKDAIKDIKIAERDDNRGRKNKIEVKSYAAGQSAGDRASFGRPVSGEAGMLRVGKV